MLSIRLILLGFFLVLPGAFSIVSAQAPRKPEKPAVAESGIKSTGAYAEIVLRNTELEAELESLLLDYTDEYPKVKELKYGVVRLKVERDRLTRLPLADLSKASLALGKIMVRKVDAEIELWKLLQSYADNHPEVRRAKRKVEIFEKAVKEILG